MGPGPSDVHPRVLEAMARPTVGHLDPAFIGMMDELKAMLQYAFKTSNRLTFPLSAPGSAGMETCFANLVEPGDRVIVCINGVFGMRMAENVRRMRGELVVVEDPWGSPVDLDKVEQTLREHPDARVLAFVHAETSTGTRSDAEQLCALARQHECLTIVDAVTSLGGIDVDVDGWGIDAIYSGTQKCLSCTPGLSPISFSQRAEDVIRNRKTPVQSWFQDMNLIMAYWQGDEYGARSYHHTAPINALYGLHESLVMLQNEGLENAFVRHRRHHESLRQGLESLEIAFQVDEAWRLPQLNSVSIPEGVDDAEVRSRLLQEYNLEIGAGLGQCAGKVWRIGLMGTSANQGNVELLLGALGEVLDRR